VAVIQDPFSPKRSHRGDHSGAWCRLSRLPQPSSITALMPPYSGSAGSLANVTPLSVPQVHVGPTVEPVRSAPLPSTRTTSP
jgi:hypothetical protein